MHLTASHIKTCSLDQETDFKQHMNSLQWHAINSAPWGKDFMAPTVNFKIAHNNQTLFLEFQVYENEILAKHNKHYTAVFEDSCVEFFVAFDGDHNYYNFEFNCLGSCNAKWGESRNLRQYLKPQAIEEIKTLTQIKRFNQNPTPKFHWNLSVEIPISVFLFSNLKSFKGEKATANFYKCGDALSHPHYLSWSPIKANHPDFHLKNFFGAIEFE